MVKCGTLPVFPYYMYLVIGRYTVYGGPRGRIGNAGVYIVRFCSRATLRRCTCTSFVFSLLASHVWLHVLSSGVVVNGLASACALRRRV